MPTDISMLGWGTVQDQYGNARTGLGYTLARGGATVLTGTTDANGQITGSLPEGVYTLVIGGLTKVVPVPSTTEYAAGGIVADGVTDDAAALQVALDTGRVVNLGGQTVIVGTGLKIPTGGGIGNGTIKRKAGAAICVLANAESANLAGTNDANLSFYDLVVDGNSASHTISTEQGIGIELYAVDNVTMRNVTVKDCPYSGIDFGGRASFQDNVGQVVAANLPPSRPPRSMSKFRFTNVRTENCGWQEARLTGNGTTVTLTTASLAGDSTITATAQGTKVFAGARVGVGAQGSSLFERATVLSVTANTVTFTAPLVFAHAIGQSVDMVKYWSDSGFGLIVRQPARDVSIVGYSSDRDYLGGCSVGQQGNIKYEPLNCLGVRISNFSIVRSSDAAPMLRCGFANDVSISDGFIGDEGGGLAASTSPAATGFSVRKFEGLRMFAGEVIYVGNPGSGTIEQVTVATVTGDTITLTAGLVNAHAADEQVFASMSDGLYLRQAGNTSQQGFKVSNVETRHCANGISITCSDDLPSVNQRHELVNITSRQNRTDGLRLADVANIAVANSTFVDNGVWGVRSQSTLTPSMTAGHRFANVINNGNVSGSWSLIAGSYKTYGSEGLVDTAAGLDLFVGPVDPRLPSASVVITAGTAYMGAFTVQQTATASNANISVVTQAGNAEVLIYDAAGNRLATTGSFVVAAAGKQTIALGASVTLAPGTKYWAVLLGDNATAAFAYVSLTSTQLLASTFNVQLTAQTIPMPATITVPAVTISRSYFVTFT